MNFLRNIKEDQNVFFEMESGIKIGEAHYDIRYEVSAWSSPVIRTCWDYEIQLTEVGQCPASWLTKEAQKQVLDSITDDIYAEIEERR